MKKIFILLTTILFCGNLFAQTTNELNSQITAIDKEISDLQNLRQTKNSDLENCAKKLKGFKIAGISTLSLTALGIGGNVLLAQKNKNLNEQIEQKKKSEKTSTDNSVENDVKEITSEKTKEAPKDSDNKNEASNAAPVEEQVATAPTSAETPAVEKSTQNAVDDAADEAEKALDNAAKEATEDEKKLAEGQVKSCEHNLTAQEIQEMFKKRKEFSDLSGINKQREELKYRISLMSKYCPSNKGSVENLYTNQAKIVCFDCN